MGASKPSLAVIGGGWAGMAAAVRATQAGWQVTLLELAGHLGGRARGVQVAGRDLDNGQHILIGAYTRTLDLMRSVGADPAALLHRQPLELRYPDGRGLRLKSGHPLWAFVRAVAGCKGWGWRERSALLTAAAHWASAGFRCAPGLTVAQLCASLPPAVRELLIDPLCVAALNTRAEDASAQVLLTVLHDAMFSGRGSADLLLPRRTLDSLLPHPAHAWLQAQGAQLVFNRRVYKLETPAGGSGWRVDGASFDRVLLACSAAEAARLTQMHDAAWAARAAALRYEPIVTVYLQAPGARLPAPMMALVESPTAPAQFAFDQGALGATPGLFSFVVSGARRWAEAGPDAAGRAVQKQALAAFPGGTFPMLPTVLKVLVEKRATFRCTPGLDRPPGELACGLLVAGDYVAGSYPATLEGAVRSAEAAVARLPAAARPVADAPRPALTQQPENNLG
jgi:squalene-associated FAD-dependent desaturase